MFHKKTLKKVDVAHYDPAWPDLFNCEAGKSTYPVELHHIVYATIRKLFIDSGIIRCPGDKHYRAHASGTLLY
jgi:hypothetical protein